MKFWSNSDIPSQGPYVPEKRLLAAVLQRAITDFIGGDGEVKDGARAWLMEEEQGDTPLTFRFICEALDLDLVSLRKAIFSQAEAREILLCPGFIDDILTNFRVVQASLN